MAAEFDFEIYSEAGYVYTDGKWESISKSPPHGLRAVGASVYTEHPSARVLSLAYDLDDGIGARLWIPGCPDPTDLFDHISEGKILEAWNCSFEWYVWENICRARMGWPALPAEQLRCAMASARAFGLPGNLSDAAKVIKADVQKIGDGTRLLKKFSKPRSPTQNDPRMSLDPLFDMEDGPKLYEYNIRDIEAERSVSAKCPPMPHSELDLWLVDQQINYRGVHIDRETLKAAIKIVDYEMKDKTAELCGLTGLQVRNPGEIAKMQKWIRSRGHKIASLDAESLENVLERKDLQPDVRRVLEIRKSLGSASVKKLYSIERRISADGRLRDLFAFCGADRTGRFSGRGPQPQNLPSGGPDVKQCKSCGAFFDKESCPCGATGSRPAEWGPEPVELAIKLIRDGHKELRKYYRDPVSAVSGCLRALFCAGPGKDLICSDYSAIEAVVLAALSGEQWRLEVFHSHGMIYETSASKITGVPFEKFVEHKKRTGQHHPLRKKIGKIAELASGYQGGIGAWRKFGADKHFDGDAEIQEAVKAWRSESPKIVEFWHGCEDAARKAIQHPKKDYYFRGLRFVVVTDVLVIQLLSGRTLKYHSPQLHTEITPWGKQVLKITYMGKSLQGSWLRLDTYGGKLVENIVQATARDILTHAMVKLERAGYLIVLHVHDEIVSEVPAGAGSITEFKSIMGDLPDWCKDWPIKAAGGWRGQRYRKD
jgi:DNA polymerase